MPIDGAHISEIDEALAVWQQGDAVVGDALSFVHVADLSKPLSPPAQAEAAGGFPPEEALTSIGTIVPGFVVVSQTCDLIRSCAERPFVQIAALASVDAEFAKQVMNGQRPSFVSVPAIFDQHLVADLDLIMTVEKSVLAGVPKDTVVRGVRSDAEARAFAEALSRRFVRFAFPDDFVAAVRPIQERLKKKHARDSAEGKAYEALREIRIIALPAWDAPQPRIEFLFVPSSDGPVSDEMDSALEGLIAKFVPTGRFREPMYRIFSLAAMSASTYVISDPLDLDYLSRT
jgi:hypothetical protein